MQSGSGGVASPADYIIGPADLLEVQVFESEKLTDTVRVSSRGDITLPLLGSISVSGLSAREAELKIENLLKQEGFIKNPHVTVFIEEYNRSVTQALRLQQATVIALALAAWITPILLLYGMGASLGWVYRGFKGN